MSCIKTPGTLNNNDWVYKFDCVAVSNIPRTNKLFYGDTSYSYISIDPTARPGMTPEQLWNYFNGGDNYEVTTYKKAILVTALSDKTRYQLYENNNGVVTNIPFQYVNKFTDIDHEIKFDSGTQLMINAEPENAVSVAVWFRIVNSQMVWFTEYNDMRDYLLSADTDASQYNGHDSSTDPEPVPSDESDEIDAELASIDGITSNTGLMDVAVIDSTNLGNLAHLVSLGWIEKNVAEGIISVKQLMSPVALTEGTGNFKTASNSTLISGTSWSANDVTGKRIRKQYNTVTVGTYSFVKYFGNFLDFNPFTSLRIYLPFAGIQSLDPNIVMGKNFKLDCVVDLLTGDLTYFGSVKGDDNSDYSVLYVWSGNCACELPVTAYDYSYKLKIGIKTAVDVATLAAGVGTGNLAGTLISGQNVINDGIESANANKYVNSGNIAGNKGFGGVLYPYIIITRPKPKPISSIMYGKPLNAIRTLNNCHGFTKVGQIHLSIPGATEYELDYINNMLKSGVILP